LGGFDARFFMYYEEVDFSFRARSIGHQSAILFSAFAYHTGCVSSGRAKGVRLFYSLRSRLKYAQKHFSAGGLICVALLTFTVEPVFRGLRAIFSGSRDELRLLVDNYQRLAAESASAACRRALTQMTRRWASSAASGGT
jgi:GT2 family glycosyltransferase